MGGVGAVRVVRSTRPIIVGSGIAGLTAALGMRGSVVLATGATGEGSSDLAQGGMAAALGPTDRPSLHAQDTSEVGGEIVEPVIADVIAGAATSEIDFLRGLGAVFDTDEDGGLALGREAGHSRRRIVHAGGDATGAEIMRTLRSAVLDRHDIDLVTGTTMTDLIRSEGRIVGALTTNVAGETVAHVAPAVVLATGGIGGVYQRSTNPRTVQGSGLAAAARQGASLADIEFVQFHPTALVGIDHPAPLVTEALRGEGAHIIDETGSRIMVGVHKDAELAPRDVVARAVWQHVSLGHRVYVDTPLAIGEMMPVRFPTAYSSARRLGIDARYQPLEVAPAEHYHMGGVATDMVGRTSLTGLWAVGEVAATGLHGANRLASNSLLEAAVMGRRAAADIERTQLVIPSERFIVPDDALSRLPGATSAGSEEVRRIAWRYLGVVRDDAGLRQAISELRDCDAPTSDACQVATLIASAALARKESRGAHYRRDYPGTNPKMAVRSLVSPPPVPSIELDRQLVLV